MGPTHRTCVAKMDSYNMLLSCIYLFLLCINVPVDCFFVHNHHRNRRQSGAQLPEIFWNKTNKIFQSDNNLHMMEANLGDSITILCPHKSLQGYQEINQSQDLYYEIFLTSKANYDTCSISEADKNNDDNETRLLFKCNSPDSRSLPREKIIQFITYSPLPREPEFISGQTYYLYTMSTGEQGGMDNTITKDSACNKWNMKMTFVVGAPVVPTDPPPGKTTPPVPSTTTTTPRVDPPTSTPITKPPTTPQIVTKSTTKKSVIDKKDNENEATNKGGQTGSTNNGDRPTVYHLPLLLCIVVHIFLLLRT